jgi:ABC-type antimicrobial peptide transport system permease subunit
MSRLPVTLIDNLDQTVSSFQGIVGSRSVGGIFVELDEEPIMVTSELVTSGFFSILIPRLEIGRPFEPNDHGEGAVPVVILSYEFWRQRFGGRRDVVGDFLPVTITSAVSMPPNPDGSRDPNPETVQLRRIVGVMAEGMESRQPFDSVDIWMPYEEVRPSLYLGEDQSAVRLEQLETWLALGRLADGADLPAAQTELRTRYTDERLQQYDVLQRFGLTSDSSRRLSAVAGLVASIRGQQRESRLALLFVVGTLGLTLVAAANASLFLLSRAPGRVRELGIRVSLGATTRRLVRQLVSEAGLLLVVATVIGVSFNAWFALFLQGLGFFIEPLDWRVLGMLTGVTMLFGGFVSLAPILGLKRLGIAASTRFVTARAGLAQRLFGAIQLTAAAVLAGLAIAFGWQLRLDLTADPGFSSEDVVVVAMPNPRSLAPPMRRASSPPAALALEAERRREIIGALPGVRAVTFADSAPGSRMGVSTVYRVGDAQQALQILVSSVGPGYAELLDMQLIQGRLLDANDPDSALINETFARKVWGRTDVVGESVSISLFNRQGVATIVGVLRDVSFQGPSRETLPGVFIPSAAGGDLYLLETTEAPAAIERLLRQKVDSGELEMEIESVAALEDLWSERSDASRQRAQFSSIAAILIIALAAFGFYGTQRYLVTAGRREYAILAALGAGPGSLRRLVLARGLVVSAPGLVFGLLLAYIAVSVLQDSWLTEAVAPLGVAALVALAISGLVVFATFGPARQAGATAPAPLLKED